MKSDNPYKKMNNYQSWSRSISKISFDSVDPVVSAAFKITKQDRIATAGSCFAQHIARHLQSFGFGYLVTENGHPLLPPELRDMYGYGLFSARFGNIYTSRQLLQLFLRAYGDFKPAEDVWVEEDGSLVDPFRPSVNPGGAASLREYNYDRNQHFSAVRRMFEQMDIFIFTLGLTECWASKVDGAVYPVCPGTVAGRFDESKHEFLNLSVDDVVKEMNDFMDRLFQVNPRARIILTVSPVPLAATAEGRHVLVSTTLSKSILRVASDVITKQRKNAFYFPSYEIITGNFNRGRYFADDLRSVTELGVSHVMKLFSQHYLESSNAPVEKVNAASGDDNNFDEMKKIVDVMCDEEMLDKQ